VTAFLTDSIADAILDADLVPSQRAPLDELRARVAGTVAVEGDPDYDAIVSPWNLAVAVRPAVAVAAREAQDVVEAVRYAARHGLAVAPQATGHGPMADFVRGMVVTTAGLDECVVHPEGWARVGAGVKWIRVVEAAAPYGLAPLSGSITDVGVVGYTTGGGLGPMARTYGLAIDRVRAIEVVTGDGVLRRATPTEHPELFFALRGGKGATGIVTAIEFDLVEQPTFYGGALFFDAEHVPAVVAAWRRWSEELPEEGTTSFAVFQLPADPAVPEVLQDRMSVSVRLVWTGDPTEGERYADQMRAVAPALLDGWGLHPYAAIDGVHTDPLDPMPALEDSVILSDFPEEAARALLEVSGPGSGSPQVLVEVRQLGGAYARGGEHDSAFALRDGRFSVLAVGIPGTPGLEQSMADIRRAVAGWTMDRTLPNFTFEPEHLPRCYDATTRARIAATVRTYDPQGVLAIGRVFTA
jgi:UDP-N-acetylenolpyruvoylglucosamine reductase